MPWRRGSQRAVACHQCSTACVRAAAGTLCCRACLCSLAVLRHAVCVRVSPQLRPVSCSPTVAHALVWGQREGSCMPPLLHSVRACCCWYAMLQCVSLLSVSASSRCVCEGEPPAPHSLLLPYRGPCTGLGAARGQLHATIAPQRACVLLVRYAAVRVSALCLCFVTGLLTPAYASDHSFMRAHGARRKTLAGFRASCWSVGAKITPVACKYIVFALP